MLNSSSWTGFFLASTFRSILTGVKSFLAEINNSVACGPGRKLVPESFHPRRLRKGTRKALVTSISDEPICSVVTTWFLFWCFGDLHLCLYQICAKGAGRSSSSPSSV